MKSQIKLSILVLFISFFSLNLSAQTAKGGWSGGGGINAGFSSFTGVAPNGDKTKLSTNSSLSISPSLGYFVADGFLVGASLGLNSSNSKSEVIDNESKNTGFSIGPFVKYYHESGIVGSASFGFGINNNTFEGVDNTFESKSGSFNWRLGVGYAIFLNDHISLEPGISYNSSTFDNNRDDDNSGKSRNSGINIGMGFNLFFGGE